MERRKKKKQFSLSVRPQAEHVVWLHPWPNHTCLNMWGGRPNCTSLDKTHNPAKHFTHLHHERALDNRMRHDRRWETNVTISSLLTFSFYLSFLSSVNGGGGNLGTFCVRLKVKVVSKWTNHQAENIWLSFFPQFHRTFRGLLHRKHYTCTSMSCHTLS